MLVYFNQTFTLWRLRLLFSSEIIDQRQVESCHSWGVTNCWSTYWRCFDACVVFVSTRPTISYFVKLQLLVEHDE